MTDPKRVSRIEDVEAGSLLERLGGVSAFSGATAEELACLGRVDLVQAEPGIDVLRLFPGRRCFWIVLSGELRVEMPASAGDRLQLGRLSAGESFGEIPLLTGQDPLATITAVTPAVLVAIQEEVFWELMLECPKIRTAVLGNMARRLQHYQSQALHREKLISLGTMWTGLMHELKNPGMAARRAASQMRANIGSLQQITVRMCGGPPLTASQKECLRDLQEQAMAPPTHPPRSSLEQSDAEEELAAWLEAQGIEDSWKLSGTLAAIGFTARALSCAQAQFPGAALSDPLHWIDALISSTQLVDTIEESISRITELVYAVKQYAYEDKAQRSQIDIHASIQSTLVILAHKFRLKELTVERRFAPDLPPIASSGQGLNQVWTNLLDNAIDAAPQKGSVMVRTWATGNEICVGIQDNGPGIPEENRRRIFEPFFTTKPVGEGTGLGLDIVQRIVADQFRGSIRFESVPGRTEFIVSLPRKS